MSIRFLPFCCVHPALCGGRRLLAFGGGVPATQVPAWKSPLLALRKQPVGGLVKLKRGSRLCQVLQLISSKRDGWPGIVSGARWMQGGTGEPGYSTAMRQRLPSPKETGRACGTGA